MPAELDLDAYLHRIGYGGPRNTTLETLAAVHRAHVGAIAFENLDPWLGRPVALDIGAVQRKLVAQRRGGFCYEHNLLLGRALAALGFGVTELAARVRWNVPTEVTRPRTHMLLAVNVAAQRYIVDAGFGGHTITAPLRLDRRVPQRTRTAMYACCATTACTRCRPSSAASGAPSTNSTCSRSSRPISRWPAGTCATTPIRSFAPR